MTNGPICVIGSEATRRRFGDDLAAYVEELAVAVLPTNALLTLDGEWRGIAGLELRRYVNAYLDELPADAIVVRVLYHG